jgi:hypothetical protein
MGGRTCIAMILLLLSSPAAALELGGPVPPPGMADLETGNGFLALADDSRIRYEAGAELMAQRVARLLPTAIERVENAHGRDFRRPVEVYVLASERSFVRLSPNAQALTVGGRIYLSPRLFRTPERVAGILTHELSHAHFMQYLSRGEHAPDLPRWFREGFAVLIAGGAGAERVTPAQAIEAILAGSGSPLGDGDIAESVSAVTGGPAQAPHMFYRQSAIFVQYLRYLDPHRFDLFVSNLLDGIEFERAFREGFGHSPMRMWRRFVFQLRSGR